MKKKVLITGSAGLIGSESVRFFHRKGFEVIGVDNDFRKYFLVQLRAQIGTENYLKRISQITNIIVLIFATRKE